MDPLERSAKRGMRKSEGGATANPLTWSTLQSGTEEEPLLHREEEEGEESNRSIEMVEEERAFFFPRWQSEDDDDGEGERVSRNRCRC
jgi:hypothetical protein